MKKTDRIGTIASLLSRALSLSSGINDHQISEARAHIRAALGQVQKQNKVEHNKHQQNQKLHDQWWGAIVSGVAKSNMSANSHIAEGNNAPESYSKVLKAIDNMLQDEYGKLNELEKPKVEDAKSTQITSYELLQD